MVEVGFNEACCFLPALRSPVRFRLSMESFTQRCQHIIPYHGDLVLRFVLVPAFLPGRALGALLRISNAFRMCFKFLRNVAELVYLYFFAFFLFFFFVTASRCASERAKMYQNSCSKVNNSHRVSMMTLFALFCHRAPLLGRLEFGPA